VKKTIDILRLIADTRLRGHAIGFTRTPADAKGPWAITLTDFERMDPVRKRQLQIHHREIVIELMAEQYREMGLSGRESRRVARQQDILVRCGYGADELQAIRYPCGRVELMPASVTRKRKSHGRHNPR